MSDLHRDVTTRRCLTSYKQVENIVIDCASLTDEIEQTDQLMRERKELFHKMWEEEQQRITTEQTIFKAQVSCCLLVFRSFLILECFDYTKRVGGRQTCMMRTWYGNCFSFGNYSKSFS